MAAIRSNIAYGKESRIMQAVLMVEVKHEQNQSLFKFKIKKRHL
jgi:hypothetical protein